MIHIFSGALTLLGSVWYTVSIIRGKTRPSRVSWWIWSGVGLILFSTYYSAGAHAALGLIFGAFIGQVITAIVATRLGEGGTSPMDLVCLVGAMLTTVLWWLTSWAFLAHVLIVVIDAFGYFPTLRKVLHSASSEDLPSWMLWAVAAAIPLLDTAHWSFIDLLYPVYIVVTDGTISVLILRHRLRRNTHASRHA